LSLFLLHNLTLSTSPFSQLSVTIIITNIVSQSSQNQLGYHCRFNFPFCPTVDRGRRGGVSVAGVTPHKPEPSLRRRGGIPPPGISMTPPNPSENGKDDDDDGEAGKDDDDNEPTQSIHGNKTTDSIPEEDEDEHETIVPINSLPPPDAETETETETGEDQESESEPLPPPPPPLDPLSEDNEPFPKPPPQITTVSRFPTNPFHDFSSFCLVIFFFVVCFLCI